MPRLLAIVVAVQLSSGAASAAPLRLTMDEAVVLATKAHPDLAAARKAVEIAEASLQRSKAWVPSNPYLSAGGGTTTQQGVGNNYGMYLSQELEIAGQRSKRIGVSQQEVAKANSEFTSAQQTLVAAVKTAFVDALVGRDRVILARQGLDFTVDLSGHLNRAKDLSEAQRMELNNALIQESRARRDIAAAQQGRDNALSTIRRLLALPQDQDIELLGAPLNQARTLPTETETIERALSKRPDLVAQERALDKADGQIALVKREAVPNITLSGNVSRFEGATLAGGDIGLHLPVFQRKTAELNEAVAERDHQRLEIESLKRTIEQEVLEARRACEVTAVDLQALRDVVVPKTEENLRLQRRLYERGEVTYSDLVGTQLEHLAARREYLDAVQAYNDALIELERVVGGDLEP
ncbi:MAG TPA: TolC family protein [Candidatus Margulisiibacteriota bacterium]|nr:TolC family protein [Candidatus Margulisiibacteriota bacterium]